MNYFSCIKQIPNKISLFNTLKGHSDLYNTLLDLKDIYFQDIVYPDYNRAKSILKKVQDKDIIVSLWYYDENSKSVKTLIGISPKFLRHIKDESKDTSDVVVLDHVDISGGKSKYSSKALYDALDEFKRKII